MSYANDSLGAIPFEHIIGTPLTAAINAQTLAAKATVDFIQQVGFMQTEQTTGSNNDYSKAPKEDYGDVRNVVFKYVTTDDAGVEKTATLSVPILTIIPIPYIRIDDMSIDFTANITEVKNDSASNSYSRTGDGGAGVYLPPYLMPIRVGFNAKVAKNSSSSSSGRYSTEYKMNIHLNAVQDDIPAGLSRVLNILENAISSKTVENTATVIVKVENYNGYNISLPGYGTQLIDKDNKEVTFEKVAYGTYQIQLTKDGETTITENIVVDGASIETTLTKAASE